MKRVLICFIAALFFTACNNNKTPDVAGSTSPVKETASAKDQPAASGCSSSLWFKEGTTLEYNLTDANGKSTAVTTTKITSVHSDGPVMVADFTNTYSKGKEVKGTYRCEGDKLYMDMQSFFENNFAGLKRAGMEIEMKNAYISFPSGMKPGDKLEQASFVMKTKKAGKEFMTVTSTIKDRKVEGVEKVTTPAGSWNCMKLSEIHSTNSEMMGKQFMSQDTKSIEWFTPGAGVVKMEMYDAAGKLQLRSELISIK